MDSRTAILLVLGLALLLWPRRPDVKIKPGVNMRGLQPEILPVIDVYRDLASRHRFEAWITDAVAPRDNPSFHPEGLALDLRRPDRVVLPNGEAAFIDPAFAEQVAEELQADLGGQYDVVLETTHIHTEFDPDRRPA